ncbi:MAG: outer membrane protein transport protein [Ignavibacteria bacterium]|nr:outer membrane protein transport protein [Ignavibacteria bacterium]
MKKLLTIALLILTHTLINAGGFQVNEHGSRAMGMGGAFIAVANDPSAIYFNPAGLTQLRGFNVMLGATFIAPRTSFRGPAPSVAESKMVRQIFYPINLYASYQLTKDLTVGFGLNNPFGLGTKWPEDWVGRYIATETRLRTFFFTPTISYKITEDISVGWGLDFVYGQVLLKRKVDISPFAGEANVKLEGNGNGFGYRFGVLAKPLKDLSIGFSYRGDVKLSFNGTAETTGPAQLQSQLPQGDVKTEVTTPQNFNFGVAYRVMPELLLAASLQYVTWSSYKDLKVDFVDPKYPDISTPKNWFDSYILRFGGEYSLLSNLDLRAGMLFDKNPIRDEYVDPTLPDSDRLGFTLGAGYKMKNIKIDVSYMFLRVAERTISNSKVYYAGNSPFNGTYNTTTHLFGFNVSYNF